MRDGERGEYFARDCFFFWDGGVCRKRYREQRNRSTWIVSWLLFTSLIAGEGRTE
jgi:hypothetical protein